jgi:mRNA-degrading endonuclease toxin of MazEF toxin-antitoxin module
MKHPQRGSIVWVAIPDPQGGNEKTRPAVILTATEEIAAATEVWVAAISTTLEDTPREVCVDLPWHNSRHPKTGLKEACAAVCTWLKKIRLDSVEEYAGVVPGKQLMEILQRVGSLPP